MGRVHGDNTKIQAYNQINAFPDIKMMKLTLICMVASMAMLVAQAINVEEDADGLLKMEARAKDLFDSLEPVASYLLQASREPFGLAVSTLSAPNAAVTKIC